MKGWLESKTIWFNLLVMVLLTVSQYSDPFISLFAADVQPLLTTWAAYLGVAGNAILRFATSIGITLKVPVAPK
jgi:hypothetical protein